MEVSRVRFVNEIYCFNVKEKVLYIDYRRDMAVIDDGYGFKVVSELTIIGNILSYKFIERFCKTFDESIKALKEISLPKKSKDVKKVTPQSTRFVKK